MESSNLLLLVCLLCLASSRQGVLAEGQVNNGEQQLAETSAAAAAADPSRACQTAAAGGSCGSTANACCPSPQCCSQYNFCGVTAAHCGTGCKPAYGRCSGPNSPSPSPSPSPSRLPRGPLMVGYYMSWRPSSGTTHDLARIPPYVNVVMLSFAKPDCTYSKGSLSFAGTGLEFSAPGSTVKAAVAALKAANSNTRVLLAVGGGAYRNWAALNGRCLQDLASDFALDGVDMDWEPAAACSLTAAGPACPTDAEGIAAARRLRALFPKSKFILSLASVHVGMYGEGSFAAAKPVSPYAGLQLALAKSAAGQALDLINIMAYDAGSPATTGFDYKQSYRAHRVWWKTQAVTIGVQIPPEGWQPPGFKGISLAEVTARAKYAQAQAGGAQYGTMLWALQKDDGCPSAQQITSAVCSAYNLSSSCSSRLLPFAGQACGGGSSSPSPSPPPSSRPYPSPSPDLPPGPSAGCPAGWLPAVGTIYDSWPKPGSKECVDYSGCQWAGMFSSTDPGPCAGPCNTAADGSQAQLLDGGSGQVCCRWPEAVVKSWAMAATYDKDTALLGKTLQIMVEGVPGRTATVNVRDVCADSDCDGCCKTNTGNKAWKLIDIEKWPASTLLGFDPTAATFDINNLDLPNAAGMRPGAPESSIMPLCYKVL